jgi:hypothetical protein
MLCFQQFIIFFKSVKTNNKCIRVFSGQLDELCNRQSTQSLRQL